MSMNLIHTNRGQVRDHSKDWSAITAIAADGYVFIDESVVELAAQLLEGVELTNGEKVTAYPNIGEPYAALVSSFGPGLLPAEMIEALRTLLSTQPGAVEMVDLIVELGLQIGFSGKEFCAAHLKAVNWPADEVSIRLSGGGMHQLLRQLGINATALSDEHGHGEVGFEEFARAVNDNSPRVDYPGERLEAFVACARRQGATHVYWA